MLDQSLYSSGVVTNDIGPFVASGNLTSIDIDAPLGEIS